MQDFRTIHAFEPDANNCFRPAVSEAALFRFQTRPNRFDDDFVGNTM